MIKKHWLKIVVALLLIGIGIAIGYYIWGYYKSPTITNTEWIISDQTQGTTANPINVYERRIAELERDKTKLLIAIQSDWEAPEIEATYPVIEDNGVYTWTWFERGGGTGLLDKGTKEAEMYFDLWAFPVDVEITREANGELGATLSTDAEGIVLNDVRLYADYGELFPERKIGIRCGAGLIVPDRAVIMGGVEYSGWGVQYQYSEDHTVLLTKAWYF